MFKDYFWITSLLSFIFGLFISHYFLFLSNIFSFYYFFIALIFLILIIFYQKIFLISCFFIFLAIWRHQLIFQKDPNIDISNFSNQNFKLIGRIFSEPEINNSKQKIKLKIYQGLSNNLDYFKVKGKILIFTNNQPLYNYGDFLEIDGEYLKASKIDSFDYSLYLKRFNIDAVAYYPSIKKIEKINNFSPGIFSRFIFEIKKNLLNFKLKISEQFYYYLSSDSSAILHAMILADKNYLSQEARDSFSVSGISHIIAISGLHISLLSSIFLSCLFMIGVSRSRSFYLLFIFLLIYLSIISFPASACRASLMGILTSLALYQGRDSQLEYLLYFSAIFLLLINPLMIFIDIGFQLSFLAVFSILYIHPKLKIFLLERCFLKINDYFLDIISISISVQIITTPIIIYNFNQVSLIAPITNLLVLFLLPVIISLSILAIFLNFLLPFLAELVYLLLDFLLSYILLVSNFFSSWNISFLRVESWSILSSFIYYLFVFYFFKNKKK